jgi:hypothetical protein
LTFIIKFDILVCRMKNQLDLVKMFNDHGVDFIVNPSGTIVLDSCLFCNSSKSLHVTKNPDQFLCVKCRSSGNNKNLCIVLELYRQKNIKKFN